LVLYSNQKLQKKNSADWVVEHNQIRLKRVTGEVVRPTAMEILQAVFGRSCKLGEEEVRSPLEDLSNLTFSRQPANPALRISWGSEGKMVATSGVATEEGFYALETDQDQAIHNSRWYPVRLDHIKNAVAWLSQVGVIPGQPVTVGALVALRARAEKPLILFDEVNFNPSDISHFKPATGDIPGFKGNLYPCVAGRHGDGNQTGRFAALCRSARPRRYRDAGRRI
jgi:hypothetical protein